MFLFFTIEVPAVGNLSVFRGPDDCNGYGYVYVRLHWTSFGFQTNIVEEYVLLTALLHIFLSLKRIGDQKLSPGLMSGQLNFLQRQEPRGILLTTAGTRGTGEMIWKDSKNCSHKGGKQEELEGRDAWSFIGCKGEKQKLCQIVYETSETSWNTWALKRCFSISVI